MHDPIKYLVQQGFDLQYVSHAVERLKQQTVKLKSPKDFIEEIFNVIGEEYSAIPLLDLSFFEARYLYFYVVQNLLLANKRAQVLDNCDLIDKSLRQARKFCHDHKTSLLEEARELGVDTGGERTRSGTKTERALQIFSEEVEGKTPDDREARVAIMQRFQDELDMEKSGALTYYHATKKRYMTQR